MYAPPADSQPSVLSRLLQVGLDAWANFFNTHLPENVTTIAKLRATTTGDLRRLVRDDLMMT